MEENQHLRKKAPRIYGQKFSLVLFGWTFVVLVASTYLRTIQYLVIGIGLLFVGMQLYRTVIDRYQWEFNVYEIITITAIVLAGFAFIILEAFNW